MAFDAAYLLLRDENARGGSQCWTYRDTVTPAAISAAAYLAIAAGMRVGDRFVPLLAEVAIVLIHQPHDEQRQRRPDDGHTASPHR